MSAQQIDQFISDIDASTGQSSAIEENFNEPLHIGLDNGLPAPYNNLKSFDKFDTSNSFGGSMPPAGFFPDSSFSSDRTAAPTSSIPSSFNEINSGLSDFGDVMPLPFVDSTLAKEQQHHSPARSVPNQTFLRNALDKARDIATYPTMNDFVPTQTKDLWRGNMMQAQQAMPASFEPLPLSPDRGGPIVRSIDMVGDSGINSFVEKNSEQVDQQYFPVKLYNMVEKASDDIISWLPDGDGFVVHDQEKLEKEVLPAFMKSARFTSFHRQLNLYGFRSMKGKFSHDFFLRGKPNFLTLIKRKKRGLPKGESGSNESDQMAAMKAMSVISRHHYMLGYMP